MNVKRMLKALEDFISQDSKRNEHFIRDFDTRPRVIIYHSHVEPKEVKPLVGQSKTVA